MEQFIYGIGIGILICYVVMQIVVWLTMRQIKKHLDVADLMERIEQEVESSVVQVRIEEMQGTFFVYDVDNDQFLAQGTDAESLSQAVQSRAGGRTVLITQGDKDVIARFRGTIAKTDSA